MEMRQQESNSTGRCSSSNRSGAWNSEGARFCFCGQRAQIRTSWTKRNPGRRFFGCPHFGGKKSYCEYFEWYDDEMCPRGKVVINRLKKKVDAMEEEVGRFRGKQRMYKRIMLLCVLIIAVLLLKIQQ